MTQKNKIAVVFGGTGFVGKQIVRSLAAQGMIVKIATRVPEKAALLKHCGNVGQIVPVHCDYFSQESVDRCVRGADYVVNCIGILFERGKKKSFKRLHVQVPAMIASACSRADVKRFVHFSALGVDKGTSLYAKTKFEGEKTVFSVFPKAVILRPSIIFGSEDGFFNKFAELSRYLPFLPLIGGGKTRFQPVYVGDIAKAVLKCFDSSADVGGKVFELGGDRVMNFRQIYQKIFDFTGRKKWTFYVPFALAKVQGIFLGMFPTPLLTADQVESLKTDSVVSEDSLGLKELGICPVDLDLILADYLPSYRFGGGR